MVRPPDMLVNPSNHIALLVPLAQGLSVGGVMTWALRAVNGLAARGRACTLLLHPEPPGQKALEPALHPNVEIVRLANVPPFGDRPGDLSPYLPQYRAAIRSLARRVGGPVAIAPTMHGDCFGIAAAIARTEPDLLRVLGWQHSDIEYDARVLARYEPVISKFVAVSDRVESTLRTRLSARNDDIQNIPYGVEVSAQAPVRERRQDEPLRLMYTGRLEHQQKRVLALVHMSDELRRRGVQHHLNVVGDGPAAAEFHALAAGRTQITLTPPASPGRIASLLAEADAFVLPSRYEGLSVSMLEAMAAGCIPVLARTDSGALQAIEPGVNGEIADVAPEADERAAGLAMADAVERLNAIDRAAVSRAAWQTVRTRFSLDLHLDKVSRLLDEAAMGPSRSWPLDRPCAFTAAPGAVAGEGSGSVPAEGPARLSSLLQSLAGRRVLLHGSGQHTLQLAPVLAASPAAIVAVADDDRQRAGQRVLDYPIITPDQARETGATDIIISSWMHQDAIYARRQVYESQGLRVHRIYGEEARLGSGPASIQA